MQKKTILITGASGFVGAQVAQKFLQSPVDLHLLFRPTSPNWRLNLFKEKATFHEADLSNEALINQMVQNIKPHAIIHCAAFGINPLEQDAKILLKTNIECTHILIRAAAKYGVKRFIHTGSCSEFASSDYPIDEMATPSPQNLYGVSKAASTLLVVQQGVELGLETVVLRLFNLYGPHEHEKRLIPAILSACLYAKPLQLTAGEQIRDYTYIEDVAELYVQLALREAFPAGQIFHIGSGSGRSVREIGDFIETLTGCYGMLKWGALPYRPNDPKQLVSDPSKARNILGWSAQTSLEEGIKKMLRLEKVKNEYA